MSHLSPEDILIRMWSTPNPSALKFTFNVPLKKTGKSTFNSKEDCQNLPLIYSLFSIPGIKRVYIFQNQLTLTHDGQISEEAIKKHVESIVKTRILVHDADFKEEEESSIKKQNPSSNDSRINQIEEILDRTIRPGLQADGGDLEVLSANQNEIKINYQGACGGCPSALSGTLNAIENILRHELNNPNIVVTPT